MLDLSTSDSANLDLLSDLAHSDLARLNVASFDVAQFHSATFK